VVYAEDASGNLMKKDHSKVTLQIRNGPSGGKLLGSSIVKLNNGQAVFRGISLQKAGGYTLAAVDGAYASAVSDAFTVTPAAVSQMVLVQSTPASIGSGSSWSMQVAVADRYGNLVADDNSTVDVALGTHPKNAVLGGTKAATIHNGIAAFNNLSVSASGAYKFVFRVHGKALKLTSKSILF